VEWILRLVGMGGATPESKVTVFVALDGATYAALRVLAAFKGRGVHDIVREAVEAYLERDDVKSFLESYFAAFKLDARRPQNG